MSIDPASEAAALRSIAEDLMEARRYVKPRPDHVWRIQQALVRLAVIRSVDPADHDRIINNINDGLAVARSDPLILEGHLYAAARLLQSIARRLEKLENAR